MMVHFEYLTSYAIISFNDFRNMIFICFVYLKFCEIEDATKGEMSREIDVDNIFRFGIMVYLISLIIVYRLRLCLAN